MRYLIIIFFISFIVSCGSTKTTNSSISKPSKPIATDSTPTLNTENKTIENNTIDLEKNAIEMTHTESIIDTITKRPTIIMTDSTKAVYKKTESLKFDHSEWHSLLQKHVSSKGRVNYLSIKKNRSKLNSYIKQLSNNTPQNNWSKNDKLAFWINAYNALTIDLILRHYPVKSIKDIKDPWKQRYWKLGSKWYNLNEIEHKILRKMNEPRIHFAIVCASFSCPKLSNIAYNSKNLDQQLTIATKDFLADTKRNIITPNSLKLSKIFKWFASDFKTNGSLIDFINSFSSKTINKNAKKTFLEYNWSLNN